MIKDTANDLVTSNNCYSPPRASPTATTTCLTSSVPGKELLKLSIWSPPASGNRQLTAQPNLTSGSHANFVRIGAGSRFLHMPTGNPWIPN